MPQALRDLKKEVDEEAAKKKKRPFVRKKEEPEEKKVEKDITEELNGTEGNQVSSLYCHLLRSLGELLGFVLSVK